MVQHFGRSRWRRWVVGFACAAVLAGCGGASQQTVDAGYARGENAAPGAPMEARGVAVSDVESVSMEADYASDESGGSYDADGADLMDRTADTRMAQADTGAPAPQPPPQAAPQVGKPAAKPAPESPSVAKGDAMLIYTADMSLAVFEVKKSIDAIDAISRERGGFLSRRDDHSISIRVPAEIFFEVVEAIEKVGEVTSRNVVSEDVTEEYHDLAIQLQNLKAMHKRLQELLNKANTVEEALKVERELGRVAGQIDRIEGRMKFLSDRSRMSTITVTFQKKATDSVSGRPVQLPLPWLHQLGLGRLLSL